MRKFILCILVLIVISGCESFQFKGENEVTYKLDLTTESGAVVDFYCTIIADINDKDIVLDAKCKGIYENEKTGDLAECSVGVNSNKEPITKNITVEENCKVYANTKKDS
jgi:hypothetical protein